MPHQHVNYTLDGYVGIVTIDRPPVNALSSQCYEELGEVFDELAANPRVRAVVLTGAGDRAFVAGADVKEFPGFNSVTGRRYTERNNAVRDKVRTFPRPVIAALNGFALGGGLALALMCDLRFADDHVKVNLGEINMGIIGGTQMLMRFVPLGRAKELVYTGESLTAEEALGCGLVERVVPRGQALPAAIETAKLIARKSPAAIERAKRVMNLGRELPLGEAMALETQAVAELWDSPEKNEAVRAFLEKRAPSFALDPSD
ncbi:MAG: enoyl-CoA hydratase/isomerase family protein [Chloroflexi bacterium]|nr:enoyl-CoA hydratase/isomerase family protein [Chloroflexota bacterium]